MQATPPSMPAQAAQLMAAKGYALDLQRRVAVRDRRATATLEHQPGRTSCRASAWTTGSSDKSVIRFAYARFLMPISNVRDTLGDFVNQYTGYAQTTTTLGLANGAAAAGAGRSVPGQQPGAASRPARRSAATPASAARSASTNTSCVRRSTIASTSPSSKRSVGEPRRSTSPTSSTTASRVPYDVNLNMRDPAFTLRADGALLNTQVTNPFRNYLTPDEFPGSLRNNATVALGSLLVPYPQYGAITPDQHQRRPQHEDAQRRSARAAAVQPRASACWSAYAFQRDRIENWLGDIAKYKVLTDRRRDGLGVAADQPGAARASPDRGVDLADPGRPRQAVTSTTCPSRSTACSAAGSTPRRSASTRAVRCSSTRSWRQRQPEARQPDARQVVRHHACSRRRPAFTPRTNPCTTTG